MLEVWTLPDPLLETDTIYISTGVLFLVYKHKHNRYYFVYRTKELFCNVH